jgi:hypothetical protein
MTTDNAKLTKAYEARDEAEAAVRQRRVELRQAQSDLEAAPAQDRAQAADAARGGKDPEPTAPERRATVEKARLTLQGTETVLTQREAELRAVLIAERGPMLAEHQEQLPDQKAAALKALDGLVQALARVEETGGTIATLYAADRVPQDGSADRGRRQRAIVEPGSQPVRLDPEALRRGGTDAVKTLRLVRAAVAAYDPTPMRHRILNAIGDRIVPWNQLADELGVNQIDSDAAGFRDNLVSDRVLTWCDTDGDPLQPQAGFGITVQTRCLRRTTSEEQESKVQQAKRKRLEREAA